LEREGRVGQEAKYRFNWSTPVALSPHDPDILYIAGNYLFRSMDEGHNWEIISPDLTRCDASKLRREPTAGERRVVIDYCTICTVSESPCEKGVLWTGSDDGLIHVSRDNGGTWANVTPEEMPDWALTQIDASPHYPGHAYLAATSHRTDDFRPYVFKTTDYGATWEPIAAGIPEDDFVRVIREDLVRPGLLYAGTEAGVYVSLDDGVNWQSLQLNLPAAAVHDLALKERDLVAATHGRGLWILDDLSPLQQMTGEILEKDVHLFEPRSVYRLTRQAYGLHSLLCMYHNFAAQNPPAGIIVTYYLRDEPAGGATLALLDAQGQEIRTYSTRAEDRTNAPAGPIHYELRGHGLTLASRVTGVKEPGVMWGPLTWPEAEPRDTLPAAAGLNRFVVDTLYPGSFPLPGAGPTWLTSPLAPPGTYYVRLTVGDRRWTEAVQILKDPRVSASQADLEAQFALMVQIRDNVSDIHRVVVGIRELRKQLEAWRHILRDGGSGAQARQAAGDLMHKLAEVEGGLIQTRLGPDFGEERTWFLSPGLDQRLGSLGYAVARSDNAPATKMYELFDDLSQRIHRQLERLQNVLQADLKEFNDAVGESKPPTVTPSAILGQVLARHLGEDAD
jgi:hypothetical protein